MRYIFLCFLVALASCSSAANNAPDGATDASSNTRTDATRDDAGSQMDATEDMTHTDVATDSNGGDVAADANDVAVDSSDLMDIPRGTCHVDDDCPNGTCEAIGDPTFGWFTCINLYPEVTACQMGSLDNECCNSTECTAEPSGVCLERIRACSGVAPQQNNVCYYDDCATDADCSDEPNGLCIRAGAFGTPAGRCNYGNCRLDTDCTDGSDGSCIPFKDPCTGFLAGFHCVYEESVCDSDEDCKSAPNQGIPYCAPTDDGKTECLEFLPPP